MKEPGQAMGHSADRCVLIVSSAYDMALLFRVLAGNLESLPCTGLAPSCSLLTMCPISIVMALCECCSDVLTKRG